MPTSKRVPEYPRPVSPISTHEAPICADTIIFHDPDEGLEENGEERATKRRRIQHNATAYLRGQQLFILTAQLKGPFGNGWQNPWTKEKPDELQSIASRGSAPSATVRKTQTSLTPTKGHVPRTAADAGSPPKDQWNDKSLKASGLLARVPAQEDNTVDKHLPLEEGILSTRKVVDWLRQSNVPEESDNELPVLLSVSSNKVSQSRTKKWELSPIHVEFPPQVDAVVGIANNHGLQQFSTSTFKAYEGSIRRFSPPVALQVPGSESRIRAVTSSPLRERSRRRMVPSKGQGPKTKEAVTDKTGIEYTIISSKRKSQQQEPVIGDSLLFQNYDDSTADEPCASAGSNLKSHSHHNHISRDNDTHHYSEVRRVCNGVSESLHTAQEERSANQIEFAVLPFSKEMSKSLPTDLPSAQVPSYPAPPSGLSNLSSNVQMLQESLLQPSAAINAMNTTDDFSAVVAVNPTTLISEPAHHHQEPVCLPPTEEPEKYHSENAIRESQDKYQYPSSDTKSNAANTSKKLTAGGERSSARKNVTKGGPARNKKRASFVPEELSPGTSQRSIKAALKVAKSTVVNQSKTNGSKTSLSQERDREHGENADQPPLSHHESCLEDSRITSYPKSILKSSLPGTVGAHISNNGTSSSTKQDAQRPQRFDVVENRVEIFNDDDFNLDAAIDDLGGLLGSWDAEKQAARVG